MKVECMGQVTSFYHCCGISQVVKEGGGGQVHNIWESHHWSYVIIEDDNPNRSFAKNMTGYQFLLRAYFIYPVHNAEARFLFYSLGCIVVSCFI